MTEIEQLRADLATIQNAAKIAKRQGYPERSGNYDMVEGELKQKIADLEAQQELIDPWQTAKKALAQWESVDSLLNSKEKRAILAYVRNLKAKVDELNHELRCERADGGNVRNDTAGTERLRERFAELNTIQNALANALPANLEHCETRYLAIELIDRRIESVKKELQETIQ